MCAHVVPIGLSVATHLQVINETVRLFNKALTVFKKTLQNVKIKGNK